MSNHVRVTALLPSAITVRTLALVLVLCSVGLWADRAAQEFEYANKLGEEGFYGLAEIVYNDERAAYPDHQKTPRVIEEGATTNVSGHYCPIEGICSTDGGIRKIQDQGRFHSAVALRCPALVHRYSSKLVDPLDGG